MIIDQELQGRYVTLKAVELQDSEFILKLRTDIRFSKYINATKNDIEVQRRWVNCQREREGDYYFTVNSCGGSKIGLISLYNIDHTGAECGRWISEGNAIENLETIKLIHEFGFDMLGLNQIYTQTVKENLSVVSFWKRFGGYFDGYVDIEPFKLYRNVVKKEIYHNEIVMKLNNLLYKQ